MSNLGFTLLPTPLPGVNSGFDVKALHHGDFGRRILNDENRVGIFDVKQNTYDFRLDKDASTTPKRRRPATTKPRRTATTISPIARATSSGLSMFSSSSSEKFSIMQDNNRKKTQTPAYSRRRHDAILDALTENRLEHHRLFQEERKLEDSANTPQSAWRSSDKNHLRRRQQVLQRQRLRDVRQSMKEVALEIQRLEVEEQEELDKRPRITGGGGGATIPPDKFQERVFKHMVDDLTDSLGITYKDGNAKRHHDPLYYQGYEQHNSNRYKWDRLTYLLGPVAREVRILSWRAIWWILEHIQECAYYVYSYVLYALQELAHAYGFHYGGMFPNLYGTNGAFNGFAEGVSHFGNVHLNEIDDVVHGVTHAVAPVVHAAAPVVHALGKGVRHEVIRAGYPFSLASGDFVHELIVWFRRAVWFMLYTGAVTLSPQILVLTLALGCVFEWVLRFGNIEKGYLSAPHHEHYESHGYDGGHGHHGGGNGYHGKFDVDVDEDVDYEYADYGNVDYAAYAAAAAAAGEPGASYAGDYSDLFSPEAKSDSAATVAPNLSPNPQVITTAAAAEAPQRHSRKQPYSFVTPSVYEMFDEHFKPADDDFEFEASDPIVGNFDYEALRL